MIFVSAVDHDLGLANSQKDYDWSALNYECLCEGRVDVFRSLTISYIYIVCQVACHMVLWIECFCLSEICVLKHEPLM